MKIVKVHCNLRLVDRIEDTGHQADNNIEWSSEEESDIPIPTGNLLFELSRTILNVIVVVI
jgi:hypothetical protein